MLTKRVKRSKHLFRKLDAWAFDKALLYGWVSEGMKYIRVVDTEDRIVYTIGAAWFIAEAIEIEYGDEGPQLALPRAYWKTEEWEDV